MMLIVMGPVLGVSVASLYAAAFGPGFTLALLYIIYLLVRSYLNPALGPAVPLDERTGSFALILKEIVVGTLPLVGLITAALGSILIGLATPTEASAIGALGALLLSIAYGRFSWRGFHQALMQTMMTSSMVLFLAVTSNIFGAVFSRLGTAGWVSDAILALPIPPELTLGLIAF
ncbi:MAG: TRAP transporter large permease subunit [Betaproteobacteria bacterium]|nr:TRAP transporter large permease subunit [Betaproteobacteria bacterium]